MDDEGSLPKRSPHRSLPVARCAKRFSVCLLGKFSWLTWQPNVQPRQVRVQDDLEGLPPGRMGNDVKEMIVECRTSHPVRQLRGERDLHEGEQDHILPSTLVAALESLDFASMIETVKATMNELKEEDKGTRRRRRRK